MVLQFYITIHDKVQKSFSLSAMVTNHVIAKVEPASKILVTSIPQTIEDFNNDVVKHTLFQTYCIESRRKRISYLK